MRTIRWWIADTDNDAFMQEYRLANASHLALSYLLFHHVVECKGAHAFPLHKGGHDHRFMGVVTHIYKCTSFIKHTTYGYKCMHLISRVYGIII